MPRRPSERSVSRCLPLAPLADLTWVMTRLTPRLRGHGARRSRGGLVGGGLGGRRLGGRRLGAGASASASGASSTIFTPSRQAEHGVDRQAAQLRDLLRLAQVLQPGDRRLDEVDRVLRAERLGEDVVDPGQLEHRAHAAAGDHAGTGRGRLEEHAPGAEDAGRLVGDRRAVAGHAEEVLLRALDALLDRQRDLVGLAVAVADDAVLVTHDDERGEREAPAALDHLGDAVDLDDALLQVEAGGRNGSIGGGHGSFEGSGLRTVRPPSRAPSARAATRPWYW